MEAEDAGQGTSIDSIKGINIRSNSSIPRQMKSSFKVPFVKFDLKTDSLNQYLQDFMSTLNDHGRLIRHIQAQLTRRVHDTQLGNIFEALGLSVPISNQTAEIDISKGENYLHLKEELFASKLHFKDFENLQKGANSFAYKLFYQSQAVTMLHQQKEKLSQKMASIESKTDQRVTVEKFKAKMKKRKTKWLYLFHESQDKATEHLEQIRAKIEQKTEQIHQKIEKQIDKEELKQKKLKQKLQERCTKRELEQKLEEIEERMLKQLVQRTRRLEDRIESVHQEWQRTIREQAIKEKERFQKIELRVEGLEKDNELKQRLQSQIKQTEDKRIVLEQRLSTQEGFLRSIDQEVEKMSNQMKDLSTGRGRFGQQRYSISGPNLLSSSRPVSGFKAVKEQQPIQPVNVSQTTPTAMNSTSMQTPRKGGQISAQVSKIDFNDMFKEQFENVQNIEQDVTKLQDEVQDLKLKIFDLAGSIETKAQRADVVPIPFIREDIKNLKNQIYKTNHSLRNDIRAFEVKLKKQNYDSDLRQVNKKLLTKAGADEVGIRFKYNNDKLDALEETMKTFVIEVETVMKMLKVCQTQIGQLSLSQSDILAGTRSVNCLVCGRNEIGNVILNSPEHRLKKKQISPIQKSSQWSQFRTADYSTSNKLRRQISFSPQKLEMKCYPYLPSKVNTSQNTGGNLGSAREMKQQVSLPQTNQLKLSRKRSAPMIPKMSLIRNETEHELNMENRDEAVALQKDDLKGKNHWREKAAESNPTSGANSFRREDGYPLPKPGIMEQFIRTTFNENFIKRNILTGKLEGTKLSIRPKPH